MDASLGDAKLGIHSRVVALFQAGILVRDGAGVGFPGHLRIAVGTAEQNARLLEVWDRA